MEKETLLKSSKIADIKQRKITQELKEFVFITLDIAIRQGIGYIPMEKYLFWKYVHNLKSKIIYSCICILIHVMQELGNINTEK